MALNINGTTGISGVDASVSAPAVTGTDSNTGISFPSADTIKFSTGGVERMSITNSGVTGTGISNGKILQVVSNSSNTTAVRSGSGISDILTVSITPASASNKILLMANCMLFVSPNSNAYSGVRIYKGDSSSGTLLIRQVGGQTDGVNTYTQAGISLVHSPNTTSATTFTLAISRESSGTTSVSTDGETYSLIAQEIAA